MLTIRLQRTGKKNQADFRIVLAETTAQVKKKCLEVLGSYNPRSKGYKINQDRARYWISQRVRISPTVHNLFVTWGLMKGPKVKAFSIPKKGAEAAADKDTSKDTSSESAVPPASAKIPASTEPAAALEDKKEESAQS